MKKRITSILTLLLINSLVYAKKDIATVKNDSQGPISIYFRSGSCAHTVQLKDRTLKNVCSEESNVQPNQSVNYEWAWVHIGRFISAYDENNNFYSSPEKTVKDKREAGVAVNFPDDFHLGN